MVWITEHLDDVFHKRMVITHCKHLCEGDYLIDDREKMESVVISRICVISVPIILFKVKFFYKS